MLVSLCVDITGHGRREREREKKSILTIAISASFISLSLSLLLISPIFFPFSLEELKTRIKDCLLLLLLLNSNETFHWGDTKRYLFSAALQLLGMINNFNLTHL
jgi:hypothetical protein